FYFDKEQGRWIEVGGTVNGEWITVELDHFGQFAVLLAGPEAGSGFSDIAGHWAAAGIQEAAARQLINGYPDGTFRPDQPITQAEFIVMLVKALKLQGAGAQRSEERRVGKEGSVGCVRSS